MNTVSCRNLFILSFTLLVVMLGYGMVMPIMPFYIEHFGAGGTELGWLMSTYSLMQMKATAPQRALRFDAGMPALRRMEEKTVRTKICSTSRTREAS